ncbi:MAG: aminopeptidase [Anaerolineales bacterium]|jgi:aminopeptidase
MADSRIVNLARILVEYSTKVQPKDRVAIIGWPQGIPLINEVYRQALRAGGFPYVAVQPDEQKHIFFSEANDDQLEHVNRLQEMFYCEFEVMIGIRSEANTRSLSNIDPARQTKHKKTHAAVFETYIKRGASGELKWVGTMFPTQSYAQDAEMSLAEFEDYVYSTTFADTEDPIAHWLAIREEQQRLVDWLKGKKQLVVKGPNVDMQLSIEERPFINSDGTNNMPSGEIFTSPVEDSANGWIRFSYPAVLEGRQVEGVELRFEEGKVVEASAARNQSFLLEMLDVDAGARYLGEWAIGTNKKINRFIKNILFDEKIGGTIHLALGAGFPEAGSKNMSAIHWDMICDMRDGGQIFADDELFYESGEFKI